jgi:hypothetical protein
MPKPATQPALEGPFAKITLPRAIAVDRPRVFVNPPVVRIGSGETQLKNIQWVNRTGKTAWIWLPNGHHYLDVSPKKLLEPIEIEDGHEVHFRVKPVPREGHYNYHVYCDAIADNAEGHSEPHVTCP